MNSLAESILCADDTSVIISNENFIDYLYISKPSISKYDWFSANKLVLNLEKNKYNEI